MNCYLKGCRPVWNQRGVLRRVMYWCSFKSRHKVGGVTPLIWGVLTGGGGRGVLGGWGGGSCLYVCMCASDWSGEWCEEPAAQVLSFEMQHSAAQHSTARHSTAQQHMKFWCVQAAKWSPINKMRCYGISSACEGSISLAEGLLARRLADRQRAAAHKVLMGSLYRHAASHERQAHWQDWRLDLQKGCKRPRSRAGPPPWGLV